MDNTIKPIIAAPTARAESDLDGMRNILADALYEMGYDGTLVDPLIERNVIDFSVVDYTSDIKYQLREHYGESILWDNSLEDAVAFEVLTDSLTGELGKDWSASESDTFQERIRDVIAKLIGKLGLKVVLRYDLVKSDTLSEELESVKRHLTIDYGEFNSELPYVNLVIYTPENSRVIAVISCIVNLESRIFDTVYWKLKFREDEDKASIKFYLITTDIDDTLQIVDLPKKERAILEADLDGIYVLTVSEFQQSDKLKLFGHFIEDLKQAIEESQ
ncbi:MAG: BsaWI family type II restriction enzyme [Candidatus Poribacteria bacterium]|nr:BsaWI family type II restriction enzyme [Candidatus Poribacteria bacterium]